MVGVRERRGKLKMSVFAIDVSTESEDLVEMLNPV